MMHHSSWLMEERKVKEVEVEVEGDLSICRGCTYQSHRKTRRRREVLFCLPREVDRRSLMWLPCHVGVLHPKSPAMRIVWEDSVHGTDWTKFHLGEVEDIS